MGACPILIGADLPKWTIFNWRVTGGAPMRKKIGIFIVELLIVGCTTMQPKGPPVADIKLVLPYTFNLETKNHLENPYVAKYERDGRLLLYVASEHISIQKYPNLLEHPTLKTIESLFYAYKPEVVIVEGVNTGAELSPKSFIRHADECATTTYRRCGESSFAVNMARKFGAEYIDGEPTNVQIKDEVFGLGYTAEDLLGFYLVRQIPQFQRSGDFDRNAFSIKGEKLLRRFQHQLGTDLKFGFPEFESWYEKHMTKPKNYLDITDDDSAPHGGPEATYIQKISNKIGIIRDQAIVKTIERMLGAYSRVLVVYGGSHLLTQEPAIEGMMGKASYFYATGNVGE
jgi:hypothetical protein